VQFDEIESDARGIVESLDETPGAYERAQLGLNQAQSRQTIDLDELA
jgi:hypothetical protein